MSSDYYGAQAGEIADAGWACGTEEDWLDLNPRGIATCTREHGHDGEHRDDESGVWWPGTATIPTASTATAFTMSECDEQGRNAGMASAATPLTAVVPGQPVNGDTPAINCRKR